MSAKGLPVLAGIEEEMIKPETKLKEADYELFGKEWEKEVMKHTKKELVDIIRRMGKRNDETF